MAKELKKSCEKGLWITWKILNMTCLSAEDKIYYAYVYSFGERGCWQTDEQIGKALGRSDRTIQRYQSNCRKAGLFRIIGQGSSYRKIWAKEHPKYISSRKMKAFELRQERKRSTTNLSELPRQTCQGSTTNLSESLRQNCPTTNKGTIIITNTISDGSPSPANGQANAPQKNKQQQLEDYRIKEEKINSIEQHKKSFGYGASYQKLSPKEIEQRRQENKRRLLAGVNFEKS